MTLGTYLPQKLLLFVPDLLYTINMWDGNAFEKSDGDDLLEIEKGDKRCQLSSPPHPGCQVEEECVGFNFVFCFNTFPHLAPKGPPVVLPSQVIMVPCVFG